MNNINEMLSDIKYKEEIKLVEKIKPKYEIKTRIRRDKWIVKEVFE